MDTRFSEYRIMWVLVLFDLPTDTKKQYSKVLLFNVLKHVITCCVLMFYTESLVLVRICYFFE